MQLVLLVVFGECVGRIYGEVKRRPLYFVKKRRGCASFDKQPSATCVGESERPPEMRRRLAWELRLLGGVATL